MCLRLFISCIVIVYNKFVFRVNKIYIIINMTDLNELLKHTARSLYLSARLLPAGIRAEFSIAYLLCRYADSIADTPLLAPEKRAHWIRRFPDLIVRPDEQAWHQLVREISGFSSNIYEEKLLRSFPACLNAFNGLSASARDIILETVHAVCTGMEIDLQVFPPEDSRRISAFGKREELEHYCRLMGGAPGVFWSKLIASDTSLSMPAERFFALGQAIGDALQIVNILRDLPNDLRIGRCYFPAQELEAHGLTAADLLRPENAAKFEPVKQHWIAWGRDKLRSARTYFSALPKTQLRHRAAVAWPVLWAADTLNKLSAETDLLNPARRVKITRRRVYATMLATPPILLSNALFNAWLERKLTADERTRKK